MLPASSKSILAPARAREAIINLMQFGTSHPIGRMKVLA